MIERQFRVEFDTKRGSNLMWSDIMTTRKLKTDFEIAIITPDGNAHSIYIKRRKLSKMLNLTLRMEKLDDQVNWSVLSNK
ncbi:MAG TPA: hypothetical protein VJ369_12895 [Glutamicibacter sp.]|jgi:hypothetical protein|nr:hypothetical protein [Glutamicibacter sp.]